MPTTMEVGVRLPYGPLQPRRLLDQIQRLPAVEGDYPLRWLEGVTWEPTACVVPLLVDDETDCVPVDLSDNLTPRDCETWLTQNPFRLRDAFVRSVMTYPSINEDLVTMYLRQLSAAFAHELLDGVGGTHSLQSSATAPNNVAFGAAASTPAQGLRTLEEELATRMQGAVGYIHVPPGMLGRLVMEAGLFLVGDHWETPSGNVVISDAGYVNPPAPGGGTASTAANDWVYASGPVFFEATAPTDFSAFVGKTGGAHDATPWNRNVVTSYLSGYGILVFDPCPVTAVLIAYT